MGQVQPVLQEQIPLLSAQALDETRPAPVYELAVLEWSLAIGVLGMEIGAEVGIGLCRGRQAQASGAGERAVSLILLRSGLRSCLARLQPFLNAPTSSM